MNLPKTLAVTDDLAVAVMDFYELSMAEANTLEQILGKPSVFDLVVRRLPESGETEKITRRWTSFSPQGKPVEHEAVEEIKKPRNFLVNAGLEQAAAYLLTAHGTKELADYLREIQGITDEKFLSWAKEVKFQGDLYAMPEGTIFFAQEPQAQVHERFEEAQVFETLLLCTINPQTHVATIANDIVQAAPGKNLLEGGSRRAGSPQSALYNSRAARIGGFHISSLVAYGISYEEKVVGTVGHSYVMLHPSEYAAFKAQAKLLDRKVCFLLDTYDVKKAFATAMSVVQEEKLDHFAFRIDSGDLLAQAKWLHKELAQRGHARTSYKIVASDDLTAEKIRKLEANGADIDNYLVGTFLVHPPKPLGGVYKLAAFFDDGIWQLRGKFSENPEKATLPGRKQVYRVVGSDGYYARDVMALWGEDISAHVKKGEYALPLLQQIIKNGKQVYDFPSIDKISQRRKEELQKFKDIDTYEVIVSEGIKQAQEGVRRKYRRV